MSSHDHDLTAWLGDAADEMTPEQRATFDQLAQRYDLEVVARRPGHGTDAYHAADYADEDSAALVAAYEHAVGTFDLTARGKALREARDSAQQGGLIAILAGTSEAAAARESGISRPTLRKALGK